MSDDAKVKRFVVSTVKRMLAPTRIVKVKTKDDVSGYDGELLYRIYVVFEGDLPDPEKVAPLRVRVHNYFGERQDERTPLLIFLRPEDEADYHVPK